MGRAGPHLCIMLCGAAGGLMFVLRPLDAVAQLSQISFVTCSASAC